MIFVSLFMASSVFAVPGVDARRGLCEKKPLEYVWVEKTQACVPINPCSSKTQEILDGYCIQVGVNVSSEEIAKSMIARYVEYVLKRRVTGFVTIDSMLAWTGEYVVDVPCIGAHISDGGYYVFRFYSPEFDNLLAGACWAYGREFIDQKENENWCTVSNDKECTDIADFASMLSGKIVSGTVEKLGVLMCRLEDFD